MPIVTSQNTLVNAITDGPTLTAAAAATCIPTGALITQSVATGSMTLRQYRVESLN